MKKLVLGLAFVALAASPALAYMQVGHLPKGQTQNQQTAQTDSKHYDDPERSGGNGGPRGNPGHVPPGDPATDPVRGLDDETPARPVPEPGTMALASMGLIALGVAANKRRGG